MRGPRGAGPYSGEHFAWRDGLDFRRPYMKIKRTPLRVWVAGRFVGFFYSGLALSDPAGRGSLIRCGPFEHLIGGLGFAFPGELGGGGGGDLSGDRFDKSGMGAKLSVPI